MKSIRIATITALMLGTGCSIEDGDPSEQGDSAEEGAETLDDGGEDEDDELRTYSGSISAPWLGTSIRTGTTFGKTNDFTPTCATSTAADVSYTWTAPATSTYRFTTTGSSFDTVLHVRPFTNSAQTLACNDNASVGLQQSSVTLPITSGTTVIIVVDGKGSSTGNFHLNISEPTPCPGGCNNPPTQCHDSGPCLIDGYTGVGYCHYPAKWTGSDCVGNNWCATGWHCANYSCVPDSFRSCNTPPSDCYEPAGTCDWPMQACTYTPKPAGSACDDHDDCTTGDACTAGGACVGLDVCPVEEDPDPDPPEDPCAAWGNFEDCGGGNCCVLGSNCQICL